MSEDGGAALHLPIVGSADRRARCRTRHTRAQDSTRDLLDGIVDAQVHGGQYPSGKCSPQLSVKWRMTVPSGGGLDRLEREIGGGVIEVLRVGVRPW